MTIIKVPRYLFAAGNRWLFTAPVPVASYVVAEAVGICQQTGQHLNSRARAPVQVAHNFRLRRDSHWHESTCPTYSGHGQSDIREQWEPASSRNCWQVNSSDSFHWRQKRFLSMYVVPPLKTVTDPFQMQLTVSNKMGCYWSITIAGRRNGRFQPSVHKLASYRKGYQRNFIQATTDEEKHVRTCSTIIARP